MRKSKSHVLAKLIKLLNEETATLKTKQPSENSTAYTRRDFLTHTAKGAVGITLTLSLPAFFSACGEVNKNKNKDEILDIAILGAGIAGLNCANHLLNSGLNFQVYEATNRVGGRILTHYNDALQLGIFPEFGGDFIDTDHTDMLALAEEFKLEKLDLIEEQKTKKLTKDIYYFNNRKISEQQIIAEFKKIAPKIAKDKEAIGDNYDTDEAIRLDNFPLSEYIHSLKCAQWLKDIFTAAFVAEFGLDCSEQSSINLLDMIETNTSEGFKVFGESDERYRIKGGNAKITEALADKIGRQNIHHHFIVEAISEGDDGLYTISFKNGNKIVSKAIVCTIPFTVLRKINLKLKNMSTEKRKCIDELGYGNNTKLILGYDSAPWSDSKNKASGYLFHKDITNGWDGGQTKTEHNTNEAYVCYFGAALSDKLNSEAVKNKLSPPNHTWRTELPQKTVAGFVNELDKIFIGSKEKFVGKHVFANWIDFPYTQGSYSCYKLGQWTTISGKEIEPVGNFFFAGEHCSSDFQGFMNGGAETGRRVAEMIAAAVKKQKQLTS
ncbi:MAG: FAD-dependent oxidoreductase [Bacteroidetes bacterium]|nr:FAD-dependent oxidoreductase [Bacteroidota bacterium]